MIALNGFWLTAFSPVAIMALLGLFFTWKYRDLRSDYTFFFLATFFLFVVVWRVPIIIDRRYMLPVIVPGILFAVLFLKKLFGKWASVGKWFCGILLLVIAIAGTAKALRFQEPKPYLTEIPAMIYEDMQKNHWESAYVLILGDIGGYCNFDRSVTQSKLQTNLKFDSQSSNKEIFSFVDSRKLTDFALNYPVIYILIVSYEAGDVFTKSWTDRYGQPPKQCYEFIRKKDQKRYQLFRILSPFRAARMTVAERLKIYKKFNLLPNPDFSQKKELPVDSSVLHELNQCGVELGNINGKFYIPADWEFMPKWKNDAIPAGIEYTKQGKLHLFCNSRMFFLQKNHPFVGGKKYQIGGWVTINRKTTLSIDVRLAKNGKLKSALEVIDVPLLAGRYEWSGAVDLSDWPGEGYLSFGLLKGDIELESLYLVEQSTFNDRTVNTKPKQP